MDPQDRNSTRIARTSNPEGNHEMLSGFVAGMVTLGQVPLISDSTAAFKTTWRASQRVGSQRTMSCGGFGCGLHSQPSHRRGSGKNFSHAGTLGAFDITAFFFFWPASDVLNVNLILDIAEASQRVTDSTSNDDQ